MSKTPVAQTHKGLFGSFSSEKEPLAYCAYAIKKACDARASQAF
jgi:hypothetical protein